MDAIRRCRQTRRRCKNPWRPLAAACCIVLALTIDNAAAADAVLGSGDTIRITVFRNPDLTTEARISSEGTVVFPLIGEIEIADFTPIQGGKLIAERLRQGQFVRDPQVSVSLVEVRSRQVSVLGHVGRPGQYPIDGTNLTLTDVLALAGGISQGGADTVIVMSRRNGQLEKLQVNVPAMYQAGDLSSNILLTSGDTIFVPGVPVFYLYGAVQRPGAYPLEPETSVLSALSLGGGLTPRGTERGLQIYRRTPDGAVQTLDAELDDPVQANDVIRVKESVF